MKKLLLAAMAVLLMGAAPGEAVDMAAMMKRAKKFTTPGKNHEELKRFLGTWSIELQVLMPGVPSKKESGTVTFSWLMKGRWVKFEGTGTMMGMPLELFGILGYDSFKQSFVSVDFNGVDTAMRTAEGDMDPGGKALILYGTLDEYLTGEHDKMVKYVWRFPSRDRMVFEVHDLPIGENNTKVVEVIYRRKK